MISYAGIYTSLFIAWSFDNTNYRSLPVMSPLYYSSQGELHQQPQRLLYISCQGLHEPGTFSAIADTMVDG